jgi:DNA-binding NarL/FixJ family response regulator
MHPEKNSYHTLTEREREVLELVCKRLTSNEISEKQFISPNTVEVHRTNIFSKVKVCNTAERIIWSLKNKVFASE